MLLRQSKLDDERIATRVIEISRKQSKLIGSKTMLELLEYVERCLWIIENLENEKCWIESLERFENHVHVKELDSWNSKTKKSRMTVRLKIIFRESERMIRIATTLRACVNECLRLLFLFISSTSWKTSGLSCLIMRSWNFAANLALSAVNTSQSDSREVCSRWRRLTDNSWFDSFWISRFFRTWS